MEKANRIEWREAELGNVCTVVSGSTPSTTNKDYWDGDINWITPAEISNGNNGYYSETRKKITSEGLASTSTTLFPRGTVMLTSRAPIGKVAIAGTQMCSNQGFKNFVCDPEQINNKYLYFWLRANKAYLNSLGHGATFKEISKSIVSGIEIPIPFLNSKPDLREQERIVSILEKAEDLKEKEEKIEELFDEYLKSIFNEMFYNKGFEKLELRAVKKIISRGKSPKYVDASNLEIINQKCIYWNQLLFKNVKFQNEAFEPDENLILKPGDILINSTGTGTLGRAVVFVPEHRNKKYVPDSHVTLFRPSEKLHPIYFCYFIMTPQGQGELYGKCVSGSTNQIELSKSKLELLKIPLPPIDLQKKFARIVQQVEQIKENLKQANHNSETLFESLMQKAFRGEL